MALFLNSTPFTFNAVNRGAIGGRRGAHHSRQKAPERVDDSQTPGLESLESNLGCGGARADGALGYGATRDACEPKERITEAVTAATMRASLADAG